MKDWEYAEISKLSKVLSPEEVLKLLESANKHGGCKRFITIERIKGGAIAFAFIGLEEGIRKIIIPKTKNLLSIIKKKYELKKALERDSYNE